MRAVAALAALVVLGAAAPPPSLHAGSLTISHAVMRAVPAGVPNTAGYLTIANGGSKADLLLSAACSCARNITLHATVMHMGMSTMTMPGEIAIPAHGVATLSPGAYHLMIEGLKAAPRDGSTQVLTLRFQHAGTVVVPFAVSARVPMAPAMDMHH